MTLLDHTKTIMELERLLETFEDNPTGCEDAIRQYITDIEEGELSDKLEGYVKYIRSLEYEANSLATEANVYLEATRKRSNKADRMKAMLKWFLETTGRDKAKAGPHTIAIQANGGKRKMEIDQSKVPDGYWVESTIRSVDAERVRRELEEGVRLEFAQLAPQGTHLKIKI